MLRQPGLRSPAVSSPARVPAVSFLVILIAVALATAVLDSPDHWTAGYGLLRHAAWEGVSGGDLVAPVFIFWIGASVPLLAEGAKARSILLRAALLVGAGLVVTGYPRFDLATWRVPGVLQRAGICYAASALAYTVTSGDRRRRGAIVVSLAAWLTLAYWLIMTHVPVPAGTAGDLSREGNLAAWVDRVVLRGHAWSDHWDPDGLFSTLSSLSTALFGVVAGVCAASGQRPARAAAQLAGAGAAGIAGGILWAPMFPLNRSLWSSPFMILGAGVASLLFALWHWTTSARLGDATAREQGETPAGGQGPRPRHADPQRLAAVRR